MPSRQSSKLPRTARTIPVEASHARQEWIADTNCYRDNRFNRSNGSLPKCCRIQCEKHGKGEKVAGIQADRLTCRREAQVLFGEQRESPSYRERERSVLVPHQLPPAGLTVHGNILRRREKNQRNKDKREHIDVQHVLSTEVRR